jgi:hypothetical protein
LFIKNYLRDLAISSKVIQKEGGTAQTMAPKWIPPRAGCAKINVDASMSKQNRGGDVVVVCCREAMALVKDLQLLRVTVASDALKTEGFKGSYNMILDEVKNDASLLAEASF